MSYLEAASIGLIIGVAIGLAVVAVGLVVVSASRPTPLREGGVRRRAKPLTDKPPPPPPPPAKRPRAYMVELDGKKLAAMVAREFERNATVGQKL